MSEIKSQKVRLDWSRLLGFDQAEDARESATPKNDRDAWQAKTGPKVGNKPGVKVGIKVGVKFGTKFGQKAGFRLAR